MAHSLEQKILHQLMDKYENSKHYHGTESARRTMLNLRDLKAYQTDHYSDKAILHQAVEDLRQRGFIAYQWVPHEEGNLLDKIFLSLEAVEAIYDYLNRRALGSQVDKAMEDLDAIITTVSWIAAYKSEMHAFMKVERRFHRLVPEETYKRKLLFKTLTGLGDMTELTERLFSTRYLGDSKVFEKQVRSRLITLLKTYVDAELEDDYLLASVGLVRNYDELLLKGDLSIMVMGEWIDLNKLPFGTSLNSETILHIEEISLRGSRVLTIENKAVYYEKIKTATPEDIIIYLGGFFGKYTRHFITQLRQSGGECQYRHWGDIDLGGFMIYDTLKVILGDALTPFRMDLETLSQNVEKSLSISAEYTERLRNYSSHHPTSNFEEVLQYMIANRLKLEQESLVI
jgi:hypothetical protein